MSRHSCCACSRASSRSRRASSRGSSGFASFASFASFALPCSRPPPLSASPSSSACASEMAAPFCRASLLSHSPLSSARACACARASSSSSVSGCSGVWTASVSGEESPSSSGLSEMSLSGSPGLPSSAFPPARLSQASWESRSNSARMSASLDGPMLRCAWPAGAFNAASKSR